MQTLFRGNSLASKSMAYAFKVYGCGYLQHLLAPCMAIMVHDSEKSYEVDPTRYVTSIDFEFTVCLLTFYLNKAIQNSATPIG